MDASRRDAALPRLTLKAKMLLGTNGTGLKTSGNPEDDLSAQHLRRGSATSLRSIFGSFCRALSSRGCVVGRFTNPAEELTMDIQYEGVIHRMPVTGELIRMMNYVDDIAATLRRIQAGVPSMTEEERKRLADYMRKADPNYVAMMTTLDKG